MCSHGPWCWKNVQVLSGGNTFNGFSLIDRIYFSHAFVLEMMRRQATALGITFRKQYNDYSHTKDVVALKPTGRMKGWKRGKSYVLNLAVEVFPPANGARKGHRIWTRSIASAWKMGKWN